MELINATRMAAAFNVGLDVSGGELLVVVTKGTFVLPGASDAVRLAEEQLPLVASDTFTGDEGVTAVRMENDFAPRKPRCDVLLVGSAHAPTGAAVTRMRVGMRVGPMEKSFDVVGDRTWVAGRTSFGASGARHFSKMALSYDVAFGGVDVRSADPGEHDAFVDNPVGRGWHKHLRRDWVDGTPLPNTEQIGHAVAFPSDRYVPMAFGPVCRGWPQRLRFAGTYDDRWLQEDFPFLPRDFDERFHQAAPVDQQIAIPREPMDVELRGLTPDGIRRFRLPAFEAPVHVFPKGGGRVRLNAALDTIVFEPDEERFTMSWRVAYALKRDIFDISQVVVGRHAERFQGALVDDPEAIEPPARQLESSLQ